MNTEVIKSLQTFQSDSVWILVVDDNDISRKTISSFLKKKGYNISEAVNGQEALDILKERPYDLIITDICMPVMDGRELLKKISEQYEDIPRIVLTAHDNEDDIMLALKTGAYDYILKPIMDMNLVKYSVDRALERRFLKKERDKTIQQMEHVNRVISMLNQGKDTNEIFQVLCETLTDAIPYDKIVILDFNEASNKLIIKLARSYNSENENIGEEVILPDEFVKNLSSRNDGIIVDDVDATYKEYSVPSSIKSIVDVNYGSFISTPFVIDNKVRGFLVLASLQKEAYIPDHSRFLTLIGGQVAFSLQRGELLSDLENHSKHLEKLVKARTFEVIRTQKTTIFALSKLAEIRDNETGEHLDRMRNYSVMLAQLLKYTGEFEEIDNEFIKNIYDSSILHDIGKVGIPDSILLKPAPLTPDEFELMKKHTEIGFNALSEASENLGGDSYLHMSKDIALFHHERYDGKGYPTKKSGDQIPLSARIVTIGDIYDALTTFRPYKEAYSHNKAVSLMQEEFYRFDPHILKVFLENNQDFDKIRRQFS